MNSILTVTDFADSYDLTVLATAKSELGITDTSQDEKIAILIHQISGAISSYCNRVFAEETVEEVFRLNAGFAFFGRWTNRSELPVNSLILRRRPVNSINSIIEDGINLASTGYEFDPESGILFRLNDEDFRQTWIANKVTINYTAGYLLLDNLPYEIEKACLLWIKSAWNLLNRQDASIRSEEIPDVLRREYFDLTRNNLIFKDPPPEVMVYLGPYVEDSFK